MSTVESDSTSNRRGFAICEPFSYLDRMSAPRFRQQIPPNPAAGAREEPQFPITRRPSKEHQHRHWVTA